MWSTKEGAAATLTAPLECLQMERLHWVQHRFRQMLAGSSGRRSDSAPDGLPTKSSLDTHSFLQRDRGRRRTVFARHRPPRQESEAISKSYKCNAICTTKYSLLTFIPMNLFQQFHRSDLYLWVEHTSWLFLNQCGIKLSVGLTKRNHSFDLKLLSNSLCQSDQPAITFIMKPFKAMYRSQPGSFCIFRL